VVKGTGMKTVVRLLFVRHDAISFPNRLIARLALNFDKVYL